MFYFLIIGKNSNVVYRTLTDVGILHSLLGIDSFDNLFSHPVYGRSWELVVIENIIAKFENWETYFYRTSNGNEIDLVLTKADKRIAIEIKASTTPKVSKGFYYALEDINATICYWRCKNPLSLKKWRYGL